VRIVITNTVALNGGDAAILDRLVVLLRRQFGKDVDVVVFDSYGDVVSRYYRDLRVCRLLYLSRQNARQGKRIRLIDWLLKVVGVDHFALGTWCIKRQILPFARLLLSREEMRGLLEYARADLVISTGGTYLVENYNLAPRIFELETALQFGCALAFFTQSLGPFGQPVTRTALREIFQRSILVLLRDEESYTNLLDLGVCHDKVHIMPDVAFLFGDIESIRWARENAFIPKYGPKIAISVREWQYFRGVDTEVGQERYNKAMQALTEHLVTRYGATITFISTCQGVPEYWIDDSELATSILGTLPGVVCCAAEVDRAFHSPQAFVEIVKGFDLMIATRMHAGILALCAGTPVMSIAYEFKTRELFKQLGLEAWVLDIDNLSESALIRSVDSLMDALPSFRSQLFSKAESYYHEVVRSGVLLRQAFEEWRCEQSKMGLG